MCGDDLYAYGIMRACRVLGIEIPAELSLVGFDDLPYSELTDPPLTTVNLSARELGETAAELLQDYLTTGLRPASRVLATSLDRARVDRPSLRLLRPRPAGRVCGR